MQLMALITIINDKFYIEHTPMFPTKGFEYYGDFLREKRDAERPSVAEKHRRVDAAMAQIQQLIIDDVPENQESLVDGIIRNLEGFDVAQLEEDENWKEPEFEYDFEKYGELYKGTTMRGVNNFNMPNRFVSVDPAYINTLTWLVRHIKACMKTGKFPKNIQFWTRAGGDTFDDNYILHNKIDKKWPHIFVDNKRDQNVITLPDPYNFDMYVQRVLKCKLDMDQAPPVAWAEKKDVALWKGFRNGQLRDKDDRPFGRLNLILQSLLRPDMLDATYSGQIEKDDQHELIFKHPEGSESFERIKICEELTKYKYTIIVDGNAGDWGRQSTCLMSDAVPIIIESNFTTTYQAQLVPYYHYVPVWRNQSNLLKQIQWLRDHDSEAYQIAQNGKRAFNKLYNLPNFIEDTLSVFQKYASLMKYEAVAPHERWAFTERKYRERSESTEDPEGFITIEDFFYTVEEKEEDDDFEEDDEEGGVDEDDEKDEL